MVAPHLRALAKTMAKTYTHVRMRTTSYPWRTRGGPVEGLELQPCFAVAKPQRSVVNVTTAQFKSFSVRLTCSVQFTCQTNSTDRCLKSNKPWYCWLDVVNISTRKHDNRIATILTGSSSFSSRPHLFYHLSHHVSDKRSEIRAIVKAKEKTKSYQWETQRANEM